MRKRDSAIKKVANADENRPHNRYTDIGKQTCLIWIMIMIMMTIMIMMIIMIVIIVMIMNEGTNNESTSLDIGSLMLELKIDIGV